MKPLILHIKHANLLLAFMLSVAFIGCSDGDNELIQQADQLLIRGADISFLPEIEEYGTLYYDADGNQKDALTILKENGCNTIRLRLWHSPANGHSGLQEVDRFSQRIRQAGLKVWLDIHYSDSWADPGKQIKPEAWTNLDVTTLNDSVYQYTKRILSIIRPDYVQIGNEINHGFLWEEGRLSNTGQFISLLESGIKASRDYDPNLHVMLHFAGHHGSKEFFSLMTEKRVDFDLIGLSYYPRWHGKDLDSLAFNIDQLTHLYDKPVVLAEVAYPYTLEWDDHTHNVIGEKGQLLEAYPPTLQGQVDYLMKLRSIAMAADSCIGICYWAPEWVAYKGSLSQSGSSWENQALFDFEHNALPAMEFFREETN